VLRPFWCKLIAPSLSFFGSTAQSMAQRLLGQSGVKDVARELFHFLWFRGIGSLLPLVTWLLGLGQYGYRCTGLNLTGPLPHVTHYRHLPSSDNHGLSTQPSSAVLRITLSGINLADSAYRTFPPVNNYLLSTWPSMRDIVPVTRSRERGSP
jgi:hypothetical protein